MSTVSRADEEGYQRLENTYQAVAQSLQRKLRAITGMQRRSAHANATQSTHELRHAIDARMNDDNTIRAPCE